MATTVVQRHSSSTPSLDDKEEIMVEENENAWNHPAGFTEEEASFMSNFTDAQRAKVIRKVLQLLTTTKYD
jgi:hypothetical protein